MDEQYLSVPQYLSTSVPSLLRVPGPLHPVTYYCTAVLLYRGIAVPLYY